MQQLCTQVIRGGHVTVSITSCKTKISLVTQVSLTRLELCAAPLLTKLMNYILSGIKIGCSKAVVVDSAMVEGVENQPLNLVVLGSNSSHYGFCVHIMVYPASASL